MPARSGVQYLAGLRDARDAWYGGERVSDVTAHPAFASGAQTIAQLYDLQQQPSHCETLTYPSPQTGAPVGMSFYMPRSVDDLVQRRAMLEVWAEASCGMLDHSPDYMNIGLMALAAARDVVATADPRFGVHLLHYYEKCREGDVCLAHAPMTSPSPSVTEAISDTPMRLGVVSSRPEGLCVRGACKPVTMAPLADEIVVCGGAALRAGQGKHALAFALPVATDGLTVICRETYGRIGSRFDHPLATRFETPECMLFFKDVLVPWKRVFLSANVALHNRLLLSTGFLGHVGHHVLTRQVAKTTVLLGVAQLLGKAVGITSFLHVQAKLGEIITTLEAIRACLRRAEVDAVLGPGGVLTPQEDAFRAGQRLYAGLHPRMIEILQLLGAGGDMMPPSEADVHGPMAEDIAPYDQGAGVPATERIQLFRLAWDIVKDGFGARQQLYECDFAGDPLHLMASQYLGYDTSAAVERVQALLEASDGGHR